MKNKIYVFIKKEENIKKIIELGYKYNPECDIYFKNFEFKDKLAFSNIKTLLNDKYVKDIVNTEDLGVTYVDGKVVIDDNFNNLASQWQIVIDEENWVGFTSQLPFYFETYYNKSSLNKYCKNQIKELLSLGIIREKIIKE